MCSGKPSMWTSVRLGMGRVHQKLSLAPFSVAPFSAEIEPDLLFPNAGVAVSLGQLRTVGIQARKS